MNFYKFGNSCPNHGVKKLWGSIYVCVCAIILGHQYEFPDSKFSSQVLRICSDECRILVHFLLPLFTFNLYIRKRTPDLPIPPSSVRIRSLELAREPKTSSAADIKADMGWHCMLNRIHHLVCGGKTTWTSPDRGRSDSLIIRSAWRLLGEEKGILYWISWKLVQRNMLYRD